MILVAVIVIDAIVVIVVFTYVHMHVCRVVHGGADVFLHAVDGGAHFCSMLASAPVSRIEIIYVVLIRICSSL